MSFEMKPHQEELAALIQEQIQKRIEAKQEALDPNSIPLMTHDQQQALASQLSHESQSRAVIGSLRNISFKLMKDGVTLLDTQTEEDKLRVLEETRTELKKGPQVLIVGTNNLMDSWVRERFIQSLKDVGGSVVLVGSHSDSDKDIKGIGNFDAFISDRQFGKTETFKEAGLRALRESAYKQPELDRSEPYKKRKKGRNKSFFPGSGHY